MSEVMQGFVGVGLGLLIIGLFCYGIIQGGKNRKKAAADYQAALASGNKQAALTAGRAYYKSLRFGKPLTMVDEQCIANDISVM